MRKILAGLTLTALLALAACAGEQPGANPSTAATLPTAPASAAPTPSATSASPSPTTSPASDLPNPCKVIPAKAMKKLTGVQITKKPESVPLGTATLCGYVSTAKDTTVTIGTLIGPLESPLKKQVQALVKGMTKRIGPSVVKKTTVTGTDEAYLVTTTGKGLTQVSVLASADDVLVQATITTGRTKATARHQKSMRAVAAVLAAAV